MAQGESNRVSLHFSEETNWDETPSSPVMAEIPYVSESLAYDKRTTKSNMVRADRLTEDVIEVGGGSQGDINFEYKFSDYELLIEGALGSDFDSDSYTAAGAGGDLDFAASGGGVQVITGPSNWTANFTINTWARITGADAANNGVFKITAKSSTTLTVKNSTGTVQANAPATIITKWIRTGTTKKSYLIEKGFADLAQFIYFRGMRVSTWNMNIEAEQIITGSFGFMGSRAVGQGTTISGSKTTAGTLSVCGATANMGTIQENGSGLTTKVKAVRFNLNNNLRQLTAIANKYPIGINLGSFEITGTIEAYFEDLTLYDKFINHNDTSLVVEIDSPEDDRTILTLHNMKFTNAAPVGGGLNQDVMVSLDFISKRDSVTGSMLQVDLLT